MSFGRTESDLLRAIRESAQQGGARAGDQVRRAQPRCPADVARAAGLAASRARPAPGRRSRRCGALFADGGRNRIMPVWFAVTALWLAVGEHGRSRGNTSGRAKTAFAISSVVYPIWGVSGWPFYLLRTVRSPGSRARRPCRLTGDRLFRHRGCLWIYRCLSARSSGRRWSVYCRLRSHPGERPHIIANDAFEKPKAIVLPAMTCVRRPELTLRRLLSPPEPDDAADRREQSIGRGGAYQRRWNRPG